MDIVIVMRLTMVKIARVTNRVEEFRSESSEYVHSVQNGIVYEKKVNSFRI